MVLIYCIWKNKSWKVYNIILYPVVFAFADILFLQLSNMALKKCIQHITETIKKYYENW